MQVPRDHTFWARAPFLFLLISYMIHLFDDVWEVFLEAQTPNTQEDDIKKR